MAIQLDRRAFVEAIKQGLKVCPTMDVRFYLNGLLVKIQRKQVTIVATDGYRMLVVPLKTLGGATACGEYILDRETCRLLAGSIKVSKAKNRPMGSSMVTLKVTRAKDRARCRVAIAADDLTVNAKPIDGKFPNYASVMPKKPETRKPTAMTVVNPRYLRDGGACLMAFMGAYGGIEMMCGGDHPDPVVMVARTDKTGIYAGDITYLLMPQVQR